MADKRVSDLTAATEVSDSDIFVMEQGGAAKKATAALLKTIFGGGETGVSVDNTLTVAGAAADAKATGEKIGTVEKATAANAQSIGTLQGRVTALEGKATGINFTNWESGGFVVTMSDGTQHNGTVTFDSEGKPTSVTLNGHTLSITLPA